MSTFFFPTQAEFEDTIEHVFEKIVAKKLPKLIQKAVGKEYYTISETCEILGCTRRHLQYLRDSGQLSYVKNGKKIYFRAEDLERFFEENYIENTL